MTQKSFFFLTRLDRENNYGHVISRNAKRICCLIRETFDAKWVRKNVDLDEIIITFYFNLAVSGEMSILS